LWGRTIPIAHDLDAGFGHYEGFPTGQYTDDTQHTLCTVESIIEHRGVFPSQIAEALHRMWTTISIIGPGGSCMRAMDEYGRTGDWTTCGAPDGEAGNGTAMRTTALGLVFLGAPETLPTVVADIARITHRDRRSVAGAVATTQATLLLYANPGLGPDGLCAQLARDVAPLDAETSAHIASLPDLLNAPHDEAMASIAWAGQPRLYDEPIITPFILPTVLASLYAVIANPDDWSGAVACVISMGGDVDTTGAIVGAIMGARLGVEAIPEHLLSAVVDHDRIQSLALRLHALIRAV